MELTARQSSALGSYTQVRQRLHGQMARLARLNRQVAAGDASEETRRGAGQARSSAQSLRPQAEVWAKRTAEILPIFASEIEAQVQEDREDLVALEAGEGAIVVGGHDAAYAADGMEEDYDVIPAAWWSVPMNKMLVQAGYSPFEIDADLRMRRMLKASGQAPDLFQGYGGEADWKEYKITMDVPDAASIKVWQTNHVPDQFIKTVTDPTGGFFTTRKKTGPVGFKRQADNPAKITIEVTWKTGAGGGKQKFSKNFTGNATWEIAKTSGATTTDKKSYKIKINAGAGVAEVRVFQANNGPRVWLKTIPLGIGQVDTLKTMHTKRADNPAKLVVETVRKNPQGILVTGTKSNTFSADAEWSWTAPWLGGEDAESVAEGGGAAAAAAAVPSGNRTQARARRTSSARGIRRQTSRLAKLLKRREFLKLQFKKLKKGPAGKYLDPLRAVTLKKQLRAVNREIAKLRGERGMKKATGVIGEIGSKPRAKRIGGIGDALFYAMSPAYRVIYSTLRTRFGEHKDLSEIARALTRAFGGRRAYPSTVRAAPTGGQVPDMSSYLAGGGAAATPMVSTISTGAGGATGFLGYGTAMRIPLGGDSRPTREEALTKLDRAMRAAPLAQEIPQEKVRVIAHALVVALANAGLIAGGVPEPVTAGGLQPAQIEAAATQAADIKEPVLAATEQLATTTSELQQATAQLEEKVAAADTAIAVAEAAPAASPAAVEAQAEVQAESAEVSRLRALVETLTAQVAAQTASTAAQMQAADAQLMELATAMGAALGDHDAALAALDAMRHEGEVASVKESDFPAALAEPEPIVEGGGELLAGDLGGDPFAADAFSDFSGYGVVPGRGGDFYSGAGYGAVPSKSGNAEGKKANVDANVVIGAAGGVIGAALDLIGKGVENLGPKKSQDTLPAAAPIYIPAGGGEPAPSRSWLPWVIGGGAVAAAGVAAVLIARGGGQGNMLMSRDREGEFVPRWRAAPGFLDYDESDAPSHLPSRDRSGRFVAGTRRAAVLGGRGDRW